MNGKASPASFATEDLRLELDIAKDREDGKGFTGLEITWLELPRCADVFEKRERDRGENKRRGVVVRLRRGDAAPDDASGGKVE